MLERDACFALLGHVAGVEHDALDAFDPEEVRDSRDDVVIGPVGEAHPERDRERLTGDGNGGPHRLMDDGQVVGMDRLGPVRGRQRLERVPREGLDRRADPLVVTGGVEDDDDVVAADE